MDNGNIREVVLGFEQMLGNLPSECDDFYDALNKMSEGFKMAMNELLPLKYFSMYEDKCGSKIAIFDKYKDCKKWTDRRSNLCDVECSEITFSKFLELSSNEWWSSNYYSEEDGVLVFEL